MAMEKRPDPDKLLERVRAEERVSAGGRLKLFFGACAGVGKTYSMLEAARQRKKEGWDVVVGLVETHGRAETDALLEGLEIFPRKEVSYKGVVLREFDLDAALARRPRLILVDELAHTNAPGSRHAKRWQDVEELLGAGIGVYTTLNVQHWESLNDVVAQITGVRVRETVPDTFLERTHDIELVDLPPEDLLKRLKEGKVYRGDQADRAADNFFQPGNLIALRELALRHTAERVDAQMQAFKDRHTITDVWPAGERLLVGVSASPMSSRLIRATARLAAQLRSPWVAAHVETPAGMKVSSEERGRVIDNLRLAEKLGAETVTLTGQNVPGELLTYARARNTTKIVLGKPARPRWKEWLYGSVVNEMARRGGDVDLCVISGVGCDLNVTKAFIPRQRTPWTGIGLGIATVAVCTLLCWPLCRLVDRANLIMIYLVGTSWVAYRFGRVPSIVASALSVLSFDVFFVSPYLSVRVADTQYFLTFAVMFGVSFLISTLTSQLRGQNEQMRRREERMRALYKLSRDLSKTPYTGRMLETAVIQLKEFYKLPIMILTPDPHGSLSVSVGDPQPFGWNDHEASVARWVFDRTQMAGAGTETLGGAAGLYLPLKGISSTVGVLAVRPQDSKSLTDPEQLHLLETFATVIGGSIESTRMSEAMGRADMQMEMQAIVQQKSDTRLRVGDFLTNDRIVVFAARLSKEEVYRELLARLTPPNTSHALQAVMERERVGSTHIASYLAVPHARISGLKGIQAALGVLRQGFDDEPHEGGPTRLCLLFLGPPDKIKEHLAFLAAIGRVFQSPGTAEMLTNCETLKEILEKLREIELAAECYPFIP